jgi:tRNA pseudouridine(55) synthase
MTAKAEILALYKNLGETPLECLMRYKESHPDYESIKMTYLGRLDPMAEGLLLVLAGDTRARKEYLELDKTYEFEVLWGAKTDTYDILGIVEGGSFPHKLEHKMPSLLKKIKSKTIQAYPLFSSRSFGGDFLKARGLNIDGQDLPEKRVKIFSLEHIHTRAITGREIQEEITRKVALVKGDFRQKEIMSAWRNLLMPLANETYLVSKFIADVSSGTYIRGLANDMGEILGTGALAWSISRTRVGAYKVDL